jgi:FdrA protein
MGTGTAAVTLDEGLKRLPGANLAVISVPGEYAAPQALRALQMGLNVQLFSDNVSLDDEIALKDFALKKGLLMMGPDCGTAIINGVPLCFANRVRRGGIGVVGASGTGTQEFTCLVDALGEGISHAMGTGGRDLSQEVGGRMTEAAISLLAKDKGTKVIAVISKPPSETASKKIIAAVKNGGKPAVLVFIGYEGEKKMGDILVASTLEEGATKAAALLRGQAAAAVQRNPPDPAIIKAAEDIGGNRRYLRGLFTGGTLAAEAAWIISRQGINLYANVHVPGIEVLDDPRISREHSIIDLGDDVFTRGMLHPMIDPHSRGERLETEFVDPNTALILCDLVLGLGSHEDPAGALAESIGRGKNLCGTAGLKAPLVLASITGTEGDPQNLSGQKQKLKDAGVYLFPSNQRMAEKAAEVIRYITERRESGGRK